MAWERRGQGRYYYQTAWINGRTEKYYFGKGSVGELAAYLDELARQREKSRAEAHLAEVARLGPPEAALTALDLACAIVVGATLHASGFHRPEQGSWRRRALYSS
jgi:hypothetical protein